MKLSPRLLAILSFVKEHSIVADIGTDHGYIPVYLIENNISKKVIATDISSGSLKKAEKYINELGYENEVETRIGNGLEVLKPYEVDTAIIAGMGGLLIKEILEENIEIAKTINNFIFQPMVASEELRKYIYNNNLRIIDEKVVLEDDKYYEIIYAKWGKDYVEDEIYYEVSKKLLEKKDSKLKEFIQFKIEKTEKIVESLNKEDSEKVIERKEELSSKLSQYRKVLGYYESC